MAAAVARELKWVIGILIALVLLPMIAASVAVAAIEWMPLTAALGVVAVWMLIRWHRRGASQQTR